MPTLLTVPKLDPAEVDTTYDESVDGYWQSKKTFLINNNHAYLWSIMRYRGVMTDSPYYLYPDGTVVDSGVGWTSSVEKAAKIMGYTVKNQDVYDVVPRERFPELLDVAASFIRGQGDYLVWVEPVEDPFSTDDFLESL